MKLRGPLLSLVATGGVAAALFGGGAVQTAFTSSASGAMNASTASAGIELAGGTLTLSNAIPGDTGKPSNINITNLGSTPVQLTVEFGRGTNPVLGQMVDLLWYGKEVGSLTSLEGKAMLIGTSPLPPKGTATIPAALMLNSSADNSVLGGSDAVTYTVTGTAVDSSSTSTGTSTGKTGWDIQVNASS